MNHWRQSKLYRCQVCGAIYLHDKAYHHAVFFCPLRPMPKVQMTAFIGKTYEPTAGR